MQILELDMLDLVKIAVWHRLKLSAKPCKPPNASHRRRAVTINLASDLGAFHSGTSDRIITHNTFSYIPHSDIQERFG